MAGRVGLPELIYAGNHGLEIQGPGLDFVEPTAAALIDRLHELTTRLEESLERFPGSLVESKRLTASVHYRNVAPELWDELRQMVQDVVANDADHFVLTSGNRVWEIRPRVDWHKGQASSGRGSTSAANHKASSSSWGMIGPTRTRSPGFPMP